jgi:hypothetical protein
VQAHRPIGNKWGLKQSSKRGNRWKLFELEIVKNHYQDFSSCTTIEKRLMQDKNKLVNMNDVLARASELHFSVQGIWLKQSFQKSIEHRPTKIAE